MSCGQNAHIYYGASHTGTVTVSAENNPGRCGVVVDNSQNLEFLVSKSHGNGIIGFHLINGADVNFRATAASGNQSGIDLQVEPGSKATLDARSRLWIIRRSPPLTPV